MAVGLSWLEAQAVSRKVAMMIRWRTVFSGICKNGLSDLGFSVVERKMKIGISIFGFC